MRLPFALVIGALATGCGGASSATEMPPSVPSAGGASEPARCETPIWLDLGRLELMPSASALDGVRRDALREIVETVLRERPNVAGARVVVHDTPSERRAMPGLGSERARVIAAELRTLGIRGTLELDGDGDEPHEVRCGQPTTEPHYQPLAVLAFAFCRGDGAPDPIRP